MGCNFYTFKGRHIGKRSAAGLYCWDCGITLCKKGIEGVHTGVDYFDKCPKCGKGREEETLEESAAGRELGFNKQAFGTKTGIRTCSSFRWAIDPGELRGSRRIKDEYGRVYSKKEFYQMLEECPIQYFDRIGKEFS